MNTITRIVTGVMLAMITIAALTGCTTFISDQKPYSVRVTPQGGGELSVELRKGRKCSKDKNPHDGCMRVAHEETGIIRFYLPGSKRQVKTCADSGVNEVITSIRVTSEGLNDESDASKGVYVSSGLDPRLKKNAFIDMDSDGYVYKVNDIGKGRTQVWLINLNNHANPRKAESEFLHFWYQVTVEGCPGKAHDGQTWTSDPRVDNEGGI